MRIALVLGSAACVWADVDAALALVEPAGFVGCNDLGVVWPGQLDAWVSLHANLFGIYTARRAAKDLPPHHRVLVNAGAQASTSRPSEAITGETDHRFPGQVHSGSSGLFALKVALVDLGFDRAILCGVPMRADGAHLRDIATPWKGERSHRPGWLEALPQIRDRARSMSGWTCELLGSPTADWLGGH